MNSLMVGQRVKFKSYTANGLVIYSLIHGTIVSPPTFGSPRPSWGGIPVVWDGESVTRWEMANDLQPIPNGLDVMLGLLP